MNRAALYPGTFDPITNGHYDLIRRAASIFSRVVVAVAANPGKAPLFSLEERVEMAGIVLGDVEHLEIVGYTGLTVDFARANGIGVMVRGLRAVSDFEFEFQLATMSRQIAEEVETVFRLLEHLAANPDRGVARSPGSTPFDATYRIR